MKILIALATFNHPIITELCLQKPKNSYIEHFTRDRFEAGIHSINSRIAPDALLDFERDRALNPTEYLIQIRPYIIKSILGI